MLPFAFTTSTTNCQWKCYEKNDDDENLKKIISSAKERLIIFDAT